MSTLQDGGPAFPIPLNPGESWREDQGDPNGMTLRDWFAGMALQGMLANPDFNALKDVTVAGFAYRQADAMIEVRERKEDA